MSLIEASTPSWSPRKPATLSPIPPTVFQPVVIIRTPDVDNVLTYDDYFLILWQDSQVTKIWHRLRCSTDAGCRENLFSKLRQERLPNQSWADNTNGYWETISFWIVVVHDHCALERQRYPVQTKNFARVNGSSEVFRCHHTHS